MRLLSQLLFCTLLVTAVPASAGGTLQADQAALTRLNREYIEAAIGRNAVWFERNFATDARLVLADGRLVGKAAIAALAQKPSGVVRYEQELLEIRVLGDTAIVHGRIANHYEGGKVSRISYTDVYRREMNEAGWIVVSAQLTPATAVKG